MALSKTLVVALMAVLFAVVALIGMAHAQTSEAASLSPTSLAAFVSPCMALAFLATGVALLFGSARRI
jgi:sorbitol-specific phosphotransferase system component IIC